MAPGDGAVTQDDVDEVAGDLGNLGVGDINRNGNVDRNDEALANDSKSYRTIAMWLTIIGCIFAALSVTAMPELVLHSIIMSSIMSAVSVGCLLAGFRFAPPSWRWPAFAGLLFAVAIVVVKIMAGLASLI